ncbi:GNAT family N-acetyltransferase [Acinetobacter haemolyticus]|uniref:GNAT family N-acetyltransferase n=1 Tax=Acinetobacter haemolyticus TaxID=29430 RepID=UPI001331EC73|nr:GNAT family protein [Acinetobacter haemolyticus]NAR77670.1 GNAT family N-acetyltransferase [Acinetobacter haemolyticus]QHI18918.1 N-acetyltransferase [Acinetobacter haemolyticus]
MSRVYLRKPQLSDLAEIKQAYQNSIHLHQPWTYPPTDFEQYLQQEHRYFVCLTENHAIVGTFNISNIIRGHFHSAFLGYEAFYPYIGQGYMRHGLQLVLHEAFQILNLHRLEANIQPENSPSIRLVAGAGFVKEGFSRQYLRVGGKEWKDHERWAILNSNWTDKKYQVF